MTQLLTLWDDVAVNLIPKGAELIGVYVDGRFQTLNAAKAAFPNAYLFTITVFGRPGAHCADCETGDLTPAQAAAWARTEIGQGRKPWLYSSRDEMPAVLQALAGQNVGRSQVFLWSAHFTGTPHICSPHSCGAQFTGDATQYTDHALGKSLDESEFAVDPRPKPKPKPAPHGHARFEGTVDIATGKILGVHGIPGIGVHFAGPNKWLDVNVQLQVGQGGGQWRAKP